ncbi:MAG TPA: sensor histidine kinase [Candidatus Dormibacteraeota bacterium]|nr:sensor histidine kinase [Candidatus Dormibacteraeota bacterium]
MKTRLPLAYQILVFQVAIILLSALMGAAAALWQARQELDRQYEQRSLAIAESVASNTAIQGALLNGDPSGLIQQAAEQVRHSTGATYVVVTNRSGIRFSHPNPAMIGKPVDENPSSVLAGNTWVGVQTGTLGISARGKAPIFYQGNVIGLVSVGFLETAIFNQLVAELPGFALTVLLALGLGVVGSLLLASRLKRQTFGLEPYEIAGLLEEREASLQGIHEGAIATDRDGTITLANDEARRLLALPADCVGRKVSQVLPPGRLLKFLSGGLNDEDEVLLAGDRVLVASRRAIRVRGREIGHVATLRDSTELTGLARGLGVDSLTDALRAQAHEFANRLHTIAGLVQLGRGDDAMKLIAQTSGVHQELTEALLERVGDPVLGAMLLAKAAIASERGIELRVSDDTVMTRSALDSEDLITLLGNLIDNGLDAAASSSHERWVSVSVTEQQDELVIKVHDSGPGVPENLDGQIYQEGFSTKAGPGRKRRGFGLALVRQVARRNGGDVTVVNDGGAVFTVRLPVRVVATS